MPDRPAPGPHDCKTLVRARIGAVPVDPSREADIVDELAQHVADHYRDLLTSGVTEPDAVALALAPLDDPTRIASEIARADRPRGVAAPPPPPSGASIAGAIARDVRDAVRLLLRAPGFAAAAIITLALGIGANAAIFGVVRAVVLKAHVHLAPLEQLRRAHARRAAVVGARDSPGADDDRPTSLVVSPSNHERTAHPSTGSG